MYQKSKLFLLTQLLLVLTIEIIISTTLFGQKKNLVFRKITSSDGLPQNSVLSICEDKYGFMWFSTEDGVCKYDGVNFTIYKNDPDDSTSLIHNYVQRIIKDTDGDIWFATESGLCMYNYQKDCFKQYYDKDNRNKISYNIILNINPDPKGGIWILSNNNGIFYLNKKENTFTRYINDPENPNSLSSNNAYNVFRDRENRLWFATSNGLNYLDEKTNAFKNYEPHPNSANPIKENAIFDIKEDNNGDLWVLTFYGIEKFDPSTGVFYNICQHATNIPECINSFRHFEICPDNSIWISSTCGLYEYDPHKNIFYDYKNIEGKNHTISKNSITRIYCDSRLNLWIGAFNGGVNVSNLSYQGFAHLHKDLNNYRLVANDIYALTKDSDNNLWIGGEKYLTQYNLTEDNFNYYKIPSNTGQLAHVNSLYDNGSDLWIGSSDRIMQFNKKTKQFKLYPNPKSKHLIYNQVWNIHKDSKGDFWFASRLGLSTYNKTTDEIEYYAPDSTFYNRLVNFDVRYIHEDKEGMLWLAAFGELLKFDPSEKKFIKVKYDKESPFTRDAMFYIHECHDEMGEKLWIGTDRGLVHFDVKTGNIKRYLEKDGICNGVIFSILEDKKGNLWLSTSNGLSRFDRKNKVFKNYYYEDGLQDNEFRYGASYQDKEGVIYLGGINGINYFNPDSIYENKTTPKIYLTNFYLFNEKVFVGDSKILEKPIYLTNKTDLNYKQNIFSFDIAALSYIQPLKNQYAYKMVGLNGGWINLGNNSHISFNGIPPGKYTLKVKGSNNDGYWSTEDFSLDIYIKPPFWKTSWFLAIITLLILFIIYIFFKLRIRYITLQKKNLEKLVKQRTNDLYELNTRLEERQVELELKQEEILTQRDAIEEQNHQLKKLSIVASSTENAVIIFDKDGKIEWFNKAFEKIYGLTLEEYIQEHGETIFEASKHNNINEYIKHCLETHESCTYETQFIKGNQTKWIHTTISPITNEQGEIEKLVAIDSDISNLKYAELEISKKNEEILTQNEELELHRNHLENLIQERTKELEKAKQRAEESDRLKSAFLANMSHEIRTPMNAIIGFSNLLNSTDLDHDNKEELISHIIYNSNTLLHLIDDIIDISKIEAGQLNINKRNCQINLILDELKETFNERQKSEAKEHIKLIFTPHVKDPNFTIYTDCSRVQQIYTNLIDNAFKFTDNGSIEVGYYLENKSENPNIIAYVKDTGIGLSEEYKEIIFTRFTKIEKDKKKLYRGAGLGLAICKNLANLLGGKIWVESELNKGSAFYFSMPYVQILEKKNTIKKEPLQPNYNWEGKTILIAEDEHSNFIYFKMLLSKTNAKIIRANTGIKAIELFKNNKPDIILMDIKMPEMDGLDATRIIKAENKNIPIIATTAYAMEDDEKICMEAGCDAYISKPLIESKFISTIARFINN